jgi:hypothetical protein
MDTLNADKSYIIHLTETFEDVYTVLLYANENKYEVKNIPIILNLCDKWGAPVNVGLGLFKPNLENLRYIPNSGSVYISKILESLFGQHMIGSHKYNQAEISNILTMPDHIVGKIVKVNSKIFSYSFR